MNGHGMINATVQTPNAAVECLWADLLQNAIGQTRMECIENGWDKVLDDDELARTERATLRTMLRELSKHIDRYCEASYIVDNPDDA
jgi:hypothetical protein